MVKTVASNGIASGNQLAINNVLNVSMSSPFKLSGVIMRVILSIVGTVPTTPVDTVLDCVNSGKLTGPSKVTSFDTNGPQALAVTGKKENEDLPYIFTNPVISASGTPFEADVFIPFEDTGAINFAFNSTVISKAFSDMAPTAASLSIDIIGIYTAQNTKSRNFTAVQNATGQINVTGLELVLFSPTVNIASAFSSGGASGASLSGPQAASIQQALFLLTGQNYALAFQNLTPGPLAATLSVSNVESVLVS